MNEQAPDKRVFNKKILIPIVIVIIIIIAILITCARHRW